MPIFLIVLVAIIAVVALIVCGANKENDALGTIGFVVGVACVTSLCFTATFRPSGLPIAGDIDPGTYQVGFVYVAGDNVNVAVELKDVEGAKEHIYHYQFKKDAFDGALNPNAKKLLVIQTGSFKKLRLE